MIKYLYDVVSCRAVAVASEGVARRVIRPFFGFRPQMLRLCLCMTTTLPCLLATCCFLACSPGRQSATTDQPLAQILAGLQADSLVAKVLRDPAHEVQIIYTQIDRDAAGRPHFSTFRHRVDSTRYFYPASMVKLPLALLALEKINYLQRSGYPRLTRHVPYRLDSLRRAQQAYATDATAPDGRPSIGHDIRQIFTVSDNDAANHLFDFLGRAAINASLQEKGYTRTGIVHRLSVIRDNRYASPIQFYTPTAGIFKEGERFDDPTLRNPQTGLREGQGYYRNDSLVQKPFDFREKNWFALTDMERMLRAVLFPEAMPAASRFRLRDDDYPFLWHYMGIFPRECDYPRYDTATYHDGYVKFFLFGDTPARQSGTIRSFNKVGEAYGTLTDVAYIVDFEHNVEFILAATLLCNADGIFNDGQYEYDTVGFPFLARLGRAVYQHELKRERKVAPDLRKFREALAGVGVSKG